MESNKPNHRLRIILLIILFILIVFSAFILREGSLTAPTAPTVNVPEPATIPVTILPDQEVIASGLDIPWDFAFLPDSTILVTERKGNLVHIKNDETKQSIKLPHPVPRGEGGLLGITLHPDFALNNFLYVYMTTQNDARETKNTVFRYRYEGEKLLDEKIIISGIPGAIYHDGGRLEFGPDRLLYITTGDAQTPSIAQDLKSLGGKILRMTEDGEIPTDNPFGTAVYSYGHRNPQGLAWDNEGRLWSTEHGRSGIKSGMDEVNLIEKGKNYGWPTIEGDATKAGMEIPKLHSGGSTTWAPASLVFYKDKLFFGGLLGQSLYEVEFHEDEGPHLHEHLKNTYGRIRTVRLGPDGMIYLTTSNRDGRGKPVTEDDRLIRVNPKSL